MAFGASGMVLTFAGILTLPALQAARVGVASGPAPPSAGATHHLHRGRSIMSEQTYDDGRARNLEAMLVALAQRIRELQELGELLRHAGELTKLIGDVRSELFHYEVRATYDTPEVAESRRIVAEAKQQLQQQLQQQPEPNQWERTEWTPEDEEE